MWDARIKCVDRSNKLCTGKGGWYLVIRGKAPGIVLREVVRWKHPWKHDLDNFWIMPGPGGSGDDTVAKGRVFSCMCPRLVWLPALLQPGLAVEYEAWTAKL